MVVADRVLTGDLNIRGRVRCLLLEHLVVAEDYAWIQSERFSSDPPRSLQYREIDGNCRAPASNPPQDLPAIEGNGTPWRGELLLGGGSGFAIMDLRIFQIGESTFPVG